MEEENELSSSSCNSTIKSNPQIIIHLLSYLPIFYTLPYQSKNSKTTIITSKQVWKQSNFLISNYRSTSLSFCQVNKQWFQCSLHLLQFFTLIHATPSSSSIIKTNLFHLPPIFFHLPLYNKSIATSSTSNNNSSNSDSYWSKLQVYRGPTNAIKNLKINRVMWLLNSRIKRDRERKIYEKQKMVDNEMVLKWEDEMDISFEKESSYESLKYLYSSLFENNTLDEDESITNNYNNNTEEMEEEKEEEEEISDSDSSSSSSKEEEKKETNIIIDKNQLHDWVVIMNQGGYFVIASFNNFGHCLRHKTFHKYVTRKKQGKRQTTKDKSKSVRTSVGSQLRRMNEEHFREEVEEVMGSDEWQQILKQAKVIFMHCPGPFNKAMLFKEMGAKYTPPSSSSKLKSVDNEMLVLSQKDYRICTITVPVQEHINFTQAKSVFEAMTTVIIEK